MKREELGVFDPEYPDPTDMGIVTVKHLDQLSLRSGVRISERVEAVPKAVDVGSRGRWQLQ